MKQLFAALLLITLFVYPTISLAQQPVGGDGKSFSNDKINLGSQQSQGIKAVGNPNATVGAIVASGIQIAAILAALAVLVFIVWGAFDWITAGGDKEKIAAARKKITNAIIGLVLLSLAAFIISLVGEIVGFNPLKVPSLPKLGDPPVSLQQGSTTTP